MVSKSPEQVGTNTTTSSPPPYIQGAQLAMLNAAANLTLPFASQPPPSMVADLTDQQWRGIGTASNLADQAYAFPTTTVGQYGDYTADAAHLNPNDIQSFVSPYQKNVVDTTTQQLQEANDRQLAQIRARQGAEGAYGGTRGALEESEQNRNFGNTLATTVAGLNNQGWQNAIQPAMQNAGWQQQANIFNAQQPLQVAQLEDKLKQTPFDLQMKSLQALLQGGAMQQDVQQKRLNAPFTALDIYRTAVPSATGTTNTQPIYGTSPMQQIMPLAMLGASAFGASDRTLKTDIQKLGKDEDTGLDMYAYRYKGDPKDTMKVVGPMAQDVEKKYPGSTARIGGKLAIKPAARMMLGI